LVLEAGAGISISNSGVEWYGGERLVQTITTAGASSEFSIISARSAVHIGDGT